MHRKYHEKFKILDILAVTTQAHEGIETKAALCTVPRTFVTTQAHEGIETTEDTQRQLWICVTTQAHEGIETFSVIDNSFISSL